MCYTLALMFRPRPAEPDQTRALLELLYHVSREVATALDLRTVLQRVLFEAMRNVGGESASIVVLDDNGKPVDATIVYGQQFHEHTTQQLRDTVERGLAGWVVKNRKPALLPNTADDERWLHRPDDDSENSGAKSAICVPLLARERLVGALTLVHSISGAFNEEHLELMQAIADQAGIAVLNARLYTESQRQARVMSALAEGAASINTALRVDDVLQRILNQTIQALQVETAAVALSDSTSGELVFRAASGQNAGNILDRRIPLGEGLAGSAARDGRGVVVAETEADKRVHDLDRFAGIRTRALAVAPIVTQAGVIGVIEAINPISGAFDPDALLVLTGLGSLAGTTLHNAELYEQLDAAHQRYRELFEDSVDPILITDWTGRVLEANRQAVSLSGYSDQELRSKTIEQLHEINVAKLGIGWEALETGNSAAYESRLRCKAGAAHPIEVHVRRVEFEEATAVQWLFRDIKERKELDALRDDLTAMIYHDLRSPLGNVVASLDMLSGTLGGANDDLAQSLLSIALQSTARIQRLISSLLDLNRLEAGQPVGEQKAADPAALIEQAVNDTAQTVEGRGQVLSMSLPPGLPPLWVNADMIRRVLTNLIENAAKFTPTGGRIEILAHADRDWLELCVKDNGPGIPIEDRERVFEKFMRLRGKNHPSGLGVGLAFCQLAVLGHGGRIWVEGQPGEGSAFFFTLPCATEKQIMARE
ncbi:MAG: Adaptive-response sensory-kinase SasA [Anaerolineales bacterium]|nr:Adaptive-response sensory-kinase SasA [Anaerolineales bacterium]